MENGFLALSDSRRNFGWPTNIFFSWGNEIKGKISVSQSVSQVSGIPPLWGPGELMWLPNRAINNVQKKKEKLSSLVFARDNQLHTEAAKSYYIGKLL